MSVEGVLEEVINGKKEPKKDPTVWIDKDGNVFATPPKKQVATDKE